MSFIKQLAGETAIYGISSILGRLLNYVVMAFYLTRVFKEGEYGVVSDVYAYVAILTVVFTYRMETTFFRFAKDKSMLEKVFSTASISIFVSTVLFAGVLLLFLQPIAQLLEYPNHPEYIGWFVFVLAFDTLTAIPFARLRLENRPIRFAALKILNILVYIAAVFFFLELSPWLIERGISSLEMIYSANNRIVYVFIANFIASLVVFLSLLPSYKKLQWQWDSELWKTMMRYAMPLVVVGLAGVINQSIGVPLIKYCSPDNVNALEAAGVYSACFKLAVLMSLFIQAFNYAAEPFFFKNANKDNARQIYAQVGQAFTMVTSVVFLGITLYIDVFKFIVSPPYWVALGIVPIAALGFLFLGLYYNFSIWYKLADKTHIGAYISVGGACITLITSMVLIPKIGYYGAAWANLACFGFMAGTSYTIGQKYYPIPYPMKRMLVYIVTAVFILYCSMLLKPLLNNLPMVLLCNTILLVVYLWGLWVLEKKTIRAFWKG